MSAREVGQRLGEVRAGTATAELWFAWVGDHARDVTRYAREYLAAEEAARIGEYRIQEAAERYVVTRSLVRAVLSDRLGIPAREIRVSRTDTGKPVVTEGVHFNLSHSGDLILLALSDQRAVGIDVERKRDVSKVRALSDRWLTASERQQFDRLVQVGADESEAFLRIWSLKEAQLKALGVGISGASRAPLHSVAVLPLDSLLDSLTGPRVGDGYVGAVAFA